MSFKHGFLFRMLKVQQILCPIDINWEQIKKNASNNKQLEAFLYDNVRVHSV